MTPMKPIKFTEQDNDTKLRHYLRLLERFVSGEYTAAQYDKEFLEYIRYDQTYYNNLPTPYTIEQSGLIEEMFLTSDGWTQELHEPEESYEYDTNEYLKRSREHLARLRELLTSVD